MSIKTVTIPEDEYNDLVKNSVWLQCLEHAGVDNWEGYELAMEFLEEEEE